MGLEDELRKKYTVQEAAFEEKSRHFREDKKRAQRSAAEASDLKATSAIATAQRLSALRVRDRLEEVRRAWGTGEVDSGTISGFIPDSSGGYQKYNALRAGYSFYTAYSDLGQDYEGRDYNRGWKISKRSCNLYVLTQLEQGATALYVTTDTDPEHPPFYTDHTGPILLLGVTALLPKDPEEARKIVKDKIFDEASKMEAPSVVKMRGRQLIENNIGNYHLAVFNYMLGIKHVGINDSVRKRTSSVD